MIEYSGVYLNTKYQQFDAEQYFRLCPSTGYDDPQSYCGQVLTGRCKPIQCPHFGRECNPENALGALMVSSEGACSAWYQYRCQEYEV